MIHDVLMIVSTVPTFVAIFGSVISIYQLQRGARQHPPKTIGQLDALVTPPSTLELLIKKNAKVTHMRGAM